MSNSDQPHLVSHKVHAQYCEQIGELAKLLQAYPFLRIQEEDLKAIANSVVDPFKVAIFGRMKTGKSTLINALIGRQLAITGVEEATATINQITYNSGENLNSFTVHWKDFPPELFSLTQLQKEWNGTDSDVLERIKRTKYLELYSDSPTLKNIQIIDTPGTGSSAIDHEDIAQQFISGQQTDALIYVFPPVGRETDEEALSEFQAGCLPNSSPYNSVGVLHKWDHIYWGNDGNWDEIQSKAVRLEKCMQREIAKVFPISAPLALISRCASDEFWIQAFACLKKFALEDDLSDALRRDSKWDRDGDHKLRLSARDLGCPWASFQILLRDLYRKSPSSIAEAKNQILKLSGITELEKFLDQKFFQQAVIIRQRQTRAKVRRIIESDLYPKIIQILESQQRDLAMMDKLENMVTDNELKSWVANKKFYLEDESNKLKKQQILFDQKVIHIKNKNNQNDTIDIIHWLNSPKAAPLEAYKDVFLTLLQNSDDAENLSSQLTNFKPAFRELCLLCNTLDRDFSQKAEQLRTWIIQTIFNK